MWHLIPAILYITCVQGHHRRQPNNAYSAINNDRPKLVPYSYEYYPEQTAVQAQYSHVPSRRYPDYPAVPIPYNNPAQRQRPYIDDPYSNASPYNKIGMQGSKNCNMNDNNLRQYQSQRRPNLLEAGVFPLELDYSNEPDMDGVPVPLLEVPSYFEDLELIDNFGNYLKRQTQLDGSSTSLNDAAHQYNALLTVIIALARVVRNSCSDVDHVYDQAYFSTVDTYYKYGLSNADKVAGMIVDFIRKGNSRMPKVEPQTYVSLWGELYILWGMLKVAREIQIFGGFLQFANRETKTRTLRERTLLLYVCGQQNLTSPLLYVKELETLEALSRLARSFYSYLEEFKQATQKGTVLPYLRNSKDRLREYVMHVVNSVEHLSDKPVKCM